MGVQLGVGLPDNDAALSVRTLGAVLDAEPVPDSVLVHVDAGGLDARRLLAFALLQNPDVLVVRDPNGPMGMPCPDVPGDLPGLDVDLPVVPEVLVPQLVDHRVDPVAGTASTTPQVTHAPAHGLEPHHDRAAQGGVGLQVVLERPCRLLLALDRQPEFAGAVPLRVERRSEHLHGVQTLALQQEPGEVPVLVPQRREVRVGEQRDDVLAGALVDLELSPDAPAALGLVEGQPLLTDRRLDLVGQGVEGAA